MLDPASFGLWMNVLRRAPGSVLWLLRPKGRQFDHVAANLEAEAAARGVHPARLVWADRVPKAEHLRRHAAADLLLDTLIYGAPSTATDALRGGLPLLTVRGEQFPQRVGASLLSGDAAPAGAAGAARRRGPRVPALRHARLHAGPRAGLPRGLGGPRARGEARAPRRGAG